MDSALFACHAGPGVGLGHLKRSLVAATALKQKMNIEIDLLIEGRNLDSKFLVNLNTIYVSKGQSLSSEIIKLLEVKSYQILCIDAYEDLLDSKIQLALDLAVDKKVKVVTIDILSKITKNVDLTYIPNFLAPVLNTTHDTKSKIVFGWDCFLLGLDKPIKKTSKNEVVLILTGGSDSTSLGAIWPTILNEALPSKTNIEWVVGPFSKLPTIPPMLNINFIEHISPKNLTKIMSKAGVAATVYGVSFYELLALGIPTVVFNPYGNRNNREIEELRKLEVSLVASDYVEATHLLNILIKDETLQADLSSKARKHMGKYRGERFAKEIQLLLKGGV